MFTVTYNAIFGPVSRKFETRERAEQWARQVGKLKEADISESKPPYPDFCFHPDKCAASGRCDRDICCAD